MKLSVINPANRRLITTMEADDQLSLQKKFDQLKYAQSSWGKIPIAQRIACIKKFSNLLEREQDALANDLTLEVGKPISEAKNEIKGAIKKLKFFIEESESILETKKVHQDGNVEEFLGYEPLGVVANISAWNYPYLIGINIFIPALICGNAVLYKPSEFSLLTGKHIERLLHLAGIPNDIFICVLGNGDVGQLITELPLDGMFFTGSYRTGQSIAQKLAGKMIPTIFELGGKDPLYVTDDIANLDQVVNSAVEGVFYNNGQSCCSVERLYVHHSIYESFIKKFVEKVRELKVGDPLMAETQLGAITQKNHLGFLKSQIDDALAQGAKLICGGEFLNSTGNFIQPTVLTQVNHQMRVMREESFGPVIGVMSVKDDAEAITLMNDTDYGLTAAVYTQNLDRGRQILSQLNCGTVYLNCCDRVSAYLPWAGRKNSGFGASLSSHGLYAFCKTKSFHFKM